ncbi:MAG: type II toxin-antitoxin system VapC family toxin [Actinobacteria bacterium]|nr:type II toxin-antitoxin system VapC family toxin [Actinomycetota bacterium]
MEVVLDASVGAKWFNVKNEDNVEIALEVLRQKVLNKLEIIVPELFFLEILNAFLTKSKFSLEDTLMAEEALSKMSLRIMSQDHFLLKSAIQIAYACNLTIYDAIYIAVAQICQAILLTEDKKILANKNKYSFIKSLDEFKTFL